MIKIARPGNWDHHTAVILAHGAGQGIGSPFMSFFHQQLEARGFLSVQFNFDYIEAGRKVPDPQPKLQARFREVVEEVRQKHKPRRLVIGGKSMGGRVASYIAGDLKDVAGLVFLGYPLHPPGRLDQLRDQHLYSISKPMLFISGTKDTFAERRLLSGVIEKVGKTATIVWIEGGDHSFKVGKGSKESLERAANAMEEWLRSEVWGSASES